MAIDSWKLGGSEYAIRAALKETPKLESIRRREWRGDL